MILVSIIVPVYNVEKYLPTCLNSIINCGLKPDEMEIIIIDDETPDNSLAIAKDYAQKHAFIHVFSQKNKGLGGARNTGIGHAKGKYVLFLDSDDWILPNILPGLTKIAIENNLDVLEYGGQGIMDDGSIAYEYSANSNGQVLDGIQHFNTFHINNNTCKLYSREFILEHKLYFLERIFIEDVEFNNRVFLVAKRVMTVPTLMFQYLQTPDSITRSPNPKKRAKMLADIKEVLTITHELFKKYGHLSEAHRIFFLERTGFIVVTYFFQFFKDKSPFSEVELARDQLVKAGLFYVDQPLFDKKKNLFRMVFLKNFFLLKMAMFFRKSV